jgi:hypothetical protein
MWSKILRYSSVLLLAAGLYAGCEGSSPTDDLGDVYYGPDDLSPGIDIGDIYDVPDTVDVPDTADVPDTPDLQPSCGNGQIEGEEECDGDNFGGQTCESLNLGSGELVCTANCALDTSGCELGCQDDEFEPNNSTSSATAIEAGEYDNLVICPDNDDYYTIDVCAGGTLTVAIDFEAAEGELKAQLIDENGDALDEANPLTYVNASADPVSVILQVVGVEGAGNDYSLTVAITGCAAVDPCDPNPCTEPPSNVCDTDTVGLKVYQDPGICTVDNGGASCDYTFTVQPCEASAAQCVGGALRTYTATCTDGACGEDYTDTQCDPGQQCRDGASECSDITPCDPNPCTTPPADHCNDNNTALMEYPEVGTCTVNGDNADCEYEPNEISCEFGCENGACKQDSARRYEFYFRGPEWMDNDPSNPQICGPFTDSIEWECFEMVWLEPEGWWGAQVDVTNEAEDIEYQVRFDQNGTTKYQKAGENCANNEVINTTTGEIWIDASKDVSFTWCTANVDEFTLDPSKITETEPEVARDVIVGWNFETLPLLASAGIPVNVGVQEFTSVGTSGPYTQVNCFKDKCHSVKGWDNAETTDKYWLAPFVSTGYENLILVSSYQQSSNTGPKYFQLQYSVNGTDWIAVDGGDITVANDKTTGVLLDLPLPAALNNQAIAYLRWIATSNEAVNGLTVLEGGTSRIDEVYIAGVFTGGPVGPCQGVICNDPPDPACENGQLATYNDNGQCVVDNDQGVCQYAKTLSNCEPEVPQACVEGQLRVYSSTCADGASACSESHNDENCDEGYECLAGASECSLIQAPSCDPNPCNTPPANHCNDDNTGVVEYGAPGACSIVDGDVNCDYTPTETTCTFGCENGACKQDPTRHYAFFFRGPDWMSDVPAPQVCGPFTTSDWSCADMEWLDALGWWGVQVDVTNEAEDIEYQVRFNQGETTKYQKAGENCANNEVINTTTGEIWIDASEDDSFTWCSNADEFTLDPSKITDAEPQVALDVIVGWNFETWPLMATAGTAANLGIQEFTSVGTSGAYSSVSCFKDLCYADKGWDNAETIDKYWLATFDSTGYENLVLQSSYQKSSNTGPKYFQLQYSVNGTDWTAVDGGDVTVANDQFMTAGSLLNLPLPAALNNQATAYLRWKVTSNESVKDETILPGGTSRIDEVYIAGVAIGGGEEGPCKDVVCNTPPAPACENGQLATYNANGQCVVVNDQGVCEYDKTLSDCEPVVPKACVEGNLRTYSSTCEDGGNACTESYQDEICDFGCENAACKDDPTRHYDFYFRGPDWMDDGPNSVFVCYPAAPSDWICKAMVKDESSDWWHYQIDITYEADVIEYQIRFKESGNFKYQKAGENCANNPVINTTTGEIWIDASDNDSFNWCGDDFVLDPSKITDSNPVPQREVLVGWEFPDGNALSTLGTAGNLGLYAVTSVGTGDDYQFNTGVAEKVGKSYSVTGWDAGDQIEKYWLASFNTRGFSSLKLVSSYQYSSNTGPKDFKVQYSTDGAVWNDLDDGVIEVADNWTLGVLLDKPLPAVMNDKDLVHLRWIVTTTDSPGGTGVVSTGRSRIDEIVIDGVPMEAEGDPCEGVTCPTEKHCQNNELVTQTNKCVVQGNAGVCVSDSVTTEECPTTSECLGDIKLSVYHGVCRDGENACDVEPQDEDCADGYECILGNSECTPIPIVDPCEPNPCTEAPANVCNNTNTGYLVYQAPGTCHIEGEGTYKCVHTFTEHLCDSGQVCAGGACVETQPVKFFFRGPDWMELTPLGPQLVINETMHAFTWDSDLNWWQLELAVVDPDASIKFSVGFFRQGVAKALVYSDDCSTRLQFATATGEIWIDASDDSSMVFCRSEPYGLYIADLYRFDITKITESEPTAPPQPDPEVVVGWDLETVPAPANAGSDANRGLKSISAEGVTGTIISSGGRTTGTSCYSVNGWHGADVTDKYWLAPFDTTGYSNLKLVSSYQKSSNSGPTNFQLQYSTDNVNWTDVADGSITVKNEFTTGRLLNLDLPAALNNQPTAYLRWIVTDNASVNPGQIQPNGTSRIDEVYISGTPIVASPCDGHECNNPPANYCQGGRLVEFESTGTCFVDAGEPKCHYLAHSNTCPDPDQVTQCVDGLLRTYFSVCPNGGDACGVDYSAESCPNGHECLDGNNSCTEIPVDACHPNPCNEQQPSTCNAGNTGYHKYYPEGNCTIVGDSYTCDYDYDEVFCDADHHCENGVCVEDGADYINFYFRGPVWMDNVPFDPVIWHTSGTINLVWDNAISWWKGQLEVVNASAPITFAVAFYENYVQKYQTVIEGNCNEQSEFSFTSTTGNIYIDASDNNSFIEWCVNAFELAPTAITDTQP